MSVGAKSVASLLLVFIAPTALACSKVEYADARDWPVDQLERAYCEAGKDMSDGIRAASEAARVSMRDANAILRISDQCAEKRAMLGRVIQNVQKRALPTCR